MTQSLKASYTLDVDDAQLDTIFLEFLAVPQQRSFFTRSHRYKYKSAPLSRESQWLGPPVHLNLAEHITTGSRVQLRARVPHEGRKDSKSAAMDVNAKDGAAQQQQDLTLRFRVDGRAVEVKVKLMLSQTGAEDISCTPCNEAQPLNAPLTPSHTAHHQNTLPLASPMAEDITATDGMSQAAQEPCAGAAPCPHDPEADTAVPICTAPLQQPTAMTDKERPPPQKRSWWSLGFFSFSGHGSSGTSASVDPATPPPSEAGSLRTSLPSFFGAARLQQRPPRLAARSAGGSQQHNSCDGSCTSIEGAQPVRRGSTGGSLPTDPSGRSSRDADSPLHKRPRMSKTPSGLSFWSLGRHSKASVAPLPPRPPSRTASGRVLGDVQREVAAQGQAPGDESQRGTAAQLAAVGAASPLPPAAAAAAGALKPPRPRSRSLVQSLDEASKDLPQAFKSGAFGAKAGLAVSAPTSMAASEDYCECITLSGSHDGDDQHQDHSNCNCTTTTTAPEVATSLEQGQEDSCDATLEKAAVAAASSDSDVPSISEALRQEISTVISRLTSTSSRSSEFKANLEQLLQTPGVDEPMARAMLDSVLMEIAPFDKGAPLGNGYYVRRLHVRKTSVERSPFSGDLEGPLDSLKQHSLRVLSSGLSPTAEHSPSASETMAVPVRALYAPVDQVVAHGEWACTCVALEVAAWLDTHPSSTMNMRVLEALVVRGCSMWRSACADSAEASQQPPPDSLLGFHVALEKINEKLSEKMQREAEGGDVAAVARTSLSCSRLYEVQAAYSQVGPDGLLDKATTFPAFATAASAAAASASAAQAFVLVANEHSTVASFLPDGRVLLVNSLGRSLSPSCRHAHLLEFSCEDDFSAAFVGMNLPAGSEPSQVEAHRVSAAPPAGGDPELQLYMPQ